MGNAIHFTGVPAVVQMFQSRDPEAAWAVVSAKMILHKGDGADELKSFLNMLKRQGSNASFTLQIYESVEAAHIKSNTPNDGGFTFRLNKEDEGYTGNYLQDKIAELQKKLDEREDAEPSKLGVIGEILDHPTIQAVAPMLITRLLDALTGATTAIPAVAMAGPDQSAEYERVYAETMASINGVNDVSKMDAAINKLLAVDAKLSDHLEKLARIATEKPEQFRMLLSMLDNM